MNPAETQADPIDAPGELAVEQVKAACAVGPERVMRSDVRPNRVARGVGLVAVGCSREVAG